MKTFTQEWERYIKTLYSDWDELGAEQRKQLYMAFHAGGITMYGRLKEIAQSDETNEKKTKMATAIAKEAMECCDLYMNQEEQQN